MNDFEVAWKKFKSYVQRRKGGGSWNGLKDPPINLNSFKIEELVAEFVQKEGYGHFQEKLVERWKCENRCGEVHGIRV